MKSLLGTRSGSRALRLAFATSLGAIPVQAQIAPPSPEEVLGYSLGEHFTDYNSIRRYSLAISEASPLVEYQPYGMTPERRELFQLVIATAAHRGRLADILAANEELSRPDTPASRAAEIAASNPAVVYFSYGVHGNESASSEAALWTLWDLARGAPSVAGVLDSLIVIIDPVANPDGRERYVQWYRSVVGAEPNPDPQAREHREPWPGGRFNHYMFDLNRDWAWMSQPETRARLATWNVWNPVVHVDFHEMGYNSTYFFFPAADPINPIYPAHVLDWGRTFGQGNALAFDREGWDYFTGDSYDLFYPGYGDSWPSLVGAIGMTYEQGGSGAAGLAIETARGDTLTLRDRATHHWTAGNATLRTAASGKARLLHDYAASQRTTGEGEPDVLLVPGRDEGRILALVDHLLRQGIEVERSERAFRAGASAYPAMDERREFPAGTYRVPARQPRGRLATTLLQPRTTLNAEYSYDISAWSLPYAYGVEAHQTRSGAGAQWRAVSAVRGEAAPLSSAAAPAGYGYLVAPGSPGSTRVAAFLRQGGSARVLSREATFEGRRWPAGTWFIPARDDVQERLTRAGLGSLAVPVSTGRAEAGPDLGSNYVRPVRLPSIALLSGEGISATSFGAHWYFLEQMAGLPFTALSAPDIARTDLGEYDVVVIPGATSRALDEQARDRLRAWVEAGGRVVAVAGGAELAAEIFEIAIRESSSDTHSPARLLMGRRDRERQAWEEEMPGAILPVRIDPAHPLSWGAGSDATGETMFVLNQGGLAFEPAERLEAVAYFSDDLQAVSGVISRQNLDLLEESVWLATRRVGSGSLVLFADDPLFRLFWHAAHPLYLNALLLGGI